MVQLTANEAHLRSKRPGRSFGFFMPAQFELLAREVSGLFHPQDKCFLELLDTVDVRHINVVNRLKEKL